MTYSRVLYLVVAYVLHLCKPYKSNWLTVSAQPKDKCEKYLDDDKIRTSKAGKNVFAASFKPGQTTHATIYSPTQDVAQQQFYSQQIEYVGHDICIRSEHTEQQQQYPTQIDHTDQQQMYFNQDYMNQQVQYPQQAAYPMHTDQQVQHQQQVAYSVHTDQQGQYPPQVQYPSQVAQQMQYPPQVAQMQYLSKVAQQMQYPSQFAHPVHIAQGPYTQQSVYPDQQGAYTQQPVYPDQQRAHNQQPVYPDQQQQQQHSEYSYSAAVDSHAPPPHYSGQHLYKQLHESSERSWKDHPSKYSTPTRPPVPKSLTESKICQLAKIEKPCEHKRKKRFQIDGRSRMLLSYDDFLLCYDNNTKQALWTLEHITKEKIQENFETLDNRSSRSDVRVKTNHSTEDSDIKRGNYNRMHLATPEFHPINAKDAFVNTNIMPKAKGRFSLWYQLNCYIHELTKLHKNVYICSGPLYLPERDCDGNWYVSYKLFGKHKTAVPSHFFKVIVGDYPDGTFRFECFKLKNEPIVGHEHIRDCRVTRDQLEKEAGFEIFDKITPCMIAEAPAKWSVENHQQKMVYKETFPESKEHDARSLTAAIIQDLDKVCKENEKEALKHVQKAEALTRALKADLEASLKCARSCK